jgi:cell wall integrity and stress response component
MKSISSTVLAALVLLGTSHASTIPGLDERTSYKTLVSVGCFSSSTGMTKNSTYTYNTSGYCQQQCVGMDMSVQGLSNADECWCGDEMPPLASKQSDNSSCDDPCAGYPEDMCGGLGYYTVYLTGTEDESQVTYASATSSSTTVASTTSTAGPSVVTVVGGQTVTVSAAADTTSTAVKSSSGSPSKAGIAAGVVVGVVAAAAMAGGVFMFMRNRRRREVEEEYRKNAQINSFIGGGKTPSSAAASFTDTRLDPVLANRRMSDGSIADNQDYSRRILKVTNA